MKFYHGRRIWIGLAALILATTLDARAATRPVSIGVNAGFEQNLALNAHLGWSRIDILWSQVNPQPGVWDFAFTDAQINNAIGWGQQVLAILHHVPAWLSTDPDIPPYTTTEWSEFVRRVAQRYAGRIAAYEIWNEPDQKSISKDGIGWGRNIEEPPLYVDFVRAAAVEIRSQAPGTPVVAPSFESRNTGDGVDNRKRRILQQIQAAIYPDGPGYSFVNIISVHNNAHDTEPSRTMGWRLNYENLAYVWNHAPSLRTAPVWVTEYGWRSDKVSVAGQREKICNVTKMYTGLLDAVYTDLDDWDVRRAFIYVLKGDATRGIYYDDNFPKSVVTQYLQHLAYPALQNPAFSGDFPSCSGTGFASSTTGLSESTTDVWTSFALLGLRDPRPGIPSGFSKLFVERSEDGRSISATFEDRKGGALSVFVSPVSAENQGRRFLSETGAEWTSGPVHISVSGMRSGSPIRKGTLRSLGTVLDPAFDQACMIESVSANENEVRRLGYRPPQAPPGFTRADASIEFTRPTKGCGPEAPANAPMIEFTWTFQNDANEVIRAGIYRYGTGWQGSHIGPHSLHWSDDEGTRYWVAIEGPTVESSLTDALYAVARSMDDGFNL